MKKVIYYILLFLIVSCGSMKMRDVDMDTTQELIGKIKSMEVVILRYDITKKDAVMSQDTIIVVFDKKNKIIKQTDLFGKLVDETIYHYNGDVLDSTTTKGSDGSTSVEKFFYDKRKNIIMRNQIENGALYLSLISSYDSHGNPIELKRLFKKNKVSNSTEKLTYDYKNRRRTIHTFKEDSLTTNSYLKNHYDKKGNIIKTESIFTDDKRKDNSYFTLLSYDNRGNLICRKTNSVNNEKPEQTTCYKNQYDEKGNIIIREMYYNDKLLRKTINKIIYK